MLILSFLSFILYISYIISVIIVNGNKIPIHLSQSYYILKNGWLFTLFMFLIMFLTIIPLMEIIPIKYQFLAFLSCASIGFIGASPNFLEDLEGRVHKIGAVIAIICSQVLVYLCHPIILLTWLVLLISLLLYYIYNKSLQGSNVLFWVEILSFINVYLLLFILI